MKKFLLSASLACGLMLTPLSLFASSVRIDPISVSDSGCLLDTRSDDPYSDDFDANKWRFKYSDGILTVTWINLVANCCPDGFTTWFERDGSTLIFNVQENNSLCDCLCVFDVTSTFGTIEPGKYTIIFRNYSDVFTAEIELKEDSDFTISMDPSGIYGISPDNGILSVSPDGLLHVSAEEKSLVEIFDASGALQSRLNTAPEADIDITSLPKGIYIVKASVGTKTATLRIIR